MPGIYLKCDQCGKTLGGEEATNRWHGLNWCGEHILQDYARSIGWTGPLTSESNSDRCPKCTTKATK